MRRYRGNVTLELEDVNTGTVETFSETNMVTNAVNDLLGMNPMGLFYKCSGVYDTMMEWNSEMLPICPNMIGGILLFPNALTEQAANIYPPSSNMPVGYASNDVNASGNVKRGSMNLVESMALSDGYNYLLTPYLATICNLSQAVVKNADKTMKITYTLTEQVVAS